MLHVLYTIGPIFVIILLGWSLRSRGFLPGELIAPLNRMVYYLAIPAMIFRAVAGASFDAHFQPALLAGTLLPLVAVFGIALLVGRVFSVSRRKFGTFLQSSFHGNLGYIGLAVAYYFLGKDGFTRASILAAFLMLLQNFLAVLALQAFSSKGRSSHPLFFFAGKIAFNPVIFSAMAGIIFSLFRIPIPVPADRVLGIISGMALPLALLVIGASLSFGLIRSQFLPAIGAGTLKLLVLPGLGIALYHWLRLSPVQFLPGLILLASPTATITYVMAREMDGSIELASAAVSMNTLLSAATFVLWLGIKYGPYGSPAF
jgi:malate permease and related proteins